MQSKYNAPMVSRTEAELSGRGFIRSDESNSFSLNPAFVLKKYFATFFSSLEPSKFLILATL